MWFREYIFNVMIQPFHLLIYTILVGSAMSFASQYMIYGIIALGFIIPAENLLRSFFGFDKAGTLSAAGSFAGGALFSTLINKMNRGKSGGAGRTGGNSENDKPGVRKPSTEIKMAPPKNTIFDIDDQTPSTTTQGQEKSQDSGIVPVPVPMPLFPEGEEGPNENSAGGTRVSNTGSGSAMTARAGGGSAGRVIAPSGVSLGGTSQGSIKGLTDPVFKKGDKWRIAMGYQKQDDGTWKKTGQGLGTRLGNATSSAVYLPAKTLWDKAKTLPKTGGRLVRKAAVGGFVGGSLGAIGLAVGTASGDPSKAFKYAAAGAGAGYFGANHYGDKVAAAAGKEWQSAKVNFWGQNIKQIEQDKFDKSFLSSPKNIDTLTRELRNKRKSKRCNKERTCTSLFK